MTNQFTGEQIEAAVNAAWDEAMKHRGIGGQVVQAPTFEFVQVVRAALEAAAGVAPQAPSERESDKECPHTPRDEWRRRGYCHRCTVEAGWTLLSDQEARRELPVQPSSTVDVGKWRDVAKSVIDRRPYSEETRREIRGLENAIARAVVEAIGGESR